MNQTADLEAIEQSEIEMVSFSGTEDDPVNYKIWQTQHGDVFYLPFSYDHVFKLEFLLWNPKWVHSMFNKYWHFSFAFVLFYIISIFGIRAFMASRRPFVLKKSLIVWNLLLAIFSVLGTWRFGQEFLFAVRNRSFQDTICLSLSPEGPAGFWGFCFALSKVFELADTVFIVLRKKPLIFLHWYHHATVLIYTWHAAKELTAAGRWFVFMNYFVHSIMYTYYTLASAGFKLPKKLSMTVTSLQTLQMLIGVFITLRIVHLKFSVGNDLVCQQSNENLWLTFVIYLTFAMLFINFFYKAYISKRKSAKENGIVKHHQNGTALRGEALQNGTVKDKHL